MIVRSSSGIRATVASISTFAAAAGGGATGAGFAAAGGAAAGGAGGGGAKKASGGAKKSGGTKRALNPALSAPMNSSEQLQAIVGNQPIPRSEITKRIWDYIKKNNLQDQQNRRAINADDKLRPIFGGKNQVSMFEMTALVNKHMKPA
jgi:chromatin remodeling complex protein RSC6